MGAVGLLKTAVAVLAVLGLLAQGLLFMRSPGTTSPLSNTHDGNKVGGPLAPSDSHDGDKANNVAGTPSTKQNCDDWNGCDASQGSVAADSKSIPINGANHESKSPGVEVGSGFGSNKQVSTSSKLPPTTVDPGNSGIGAGQGGVNIDSGIAAGVDGVKVVRAGGAGSELIGSSSAAAGKKAKKAPKKRPAGNGYRKVDIGVPSVTKKHAAVDYFTANRATGAEIAAIDGSSMSRYISSGGRFPIMIVTADRDQMLARTLEALLKVRGVAKGDIYVVQDGNNAAVADVLNRFGIAYHQKTGGLRMGGDGAERIATHYGYALKHAFTLAFPTAPAVVVVEDDFLFSPDFYEYFHAVAPALEADPTLWLASAWNDNGFDYLVADPYALRRTRYFPGLGWLCPRRIFVDQLMAIWPTSHWDHWMRDPAQHRGRDIIFPEIPRDYHAGVKGTFMDGNTHNRYFGSIAMQADPAFTWDTPTGAASIEDVVVMRYDARLRQIIAAPDTVHLSSVNEIGQFTDGTGIVWYDCPPNEPNHDKMRAVAGYFGVWHEGGRGTRDGIHEVWWLGSAKLILINAHPLQSFGVLPVTGSTQPSSMRSLMPAGHQPIDWSAFLSASRPQIPLHNNLFGAVTSSPLSHLDGGNDANGPPDSGAGDSGRAAGGGVVVYIHDEDWDNQTDDEKEEHDHSNFMGDLRLPATGVSRARDTGTGQTGVAHVGAFPDNVKVVASDVMGLSCTEVCARYTGGVVDSGDSSSLAPSGWTCASSYLPVLNDCSSLRAAFECSSCGDSIGPDQPAMVDRTAPAEKGPGSCLVNGDPGQFNCEGKWTYALRLCPCTKEDGGEESAADVFR